LVTGDITNLIRKTGLLDFVYTRKTMYDYKKQACICNGSCITV